MIKRRDALLSGAALLGGALLRNEKTAAAADPPVPATPPTHAAIGYTPVVTLNSATLPWTMEDRWKTFRLVAEPVKREFAPGMIVDCWGCNGLTQGPTIEAVEGDRVRIFVTNKLPERTSVHWHGVLLPNGMDGVSGLTQPHIEPVQMALGMMGFFIVHRASPRRRASIAISRSCSTNGRSRPARRDRIRS